jgi:hypothetical protein
MPHDEIRKAISRAGGTVILIGLDGRRTALKA